MNKNAFILSLVLVLLPAYSAAQSDEIDAAVERYLTETIEFRHFIHQNPELGNREFETSLELWKVYRAIRDNHAKKQAMQKADDKTGGLGLGHRKERPGVGPQ